MFSAVGRAEESACPVRLVLAAGLAAAWANAADSDAGWGEALDAGVAAVFSAVGPAEGLACPVRLALALVLASAWANAAADSDAGRGEALV